MLGLTEEEFDFFMDVIWYYGTGCLRIERFKEIYDRLKKQQAMTKLR